MSGRMLVSEYVSEKREINRRMARACNVATWLVENFHKFGGTSLSSKEIRKEIRFKLDPKLRHLKDNRVEEEIRGDHRAHGDAWGKSGLRLSAIGPKNQREIEFSLPNLKRCTSYLLGQGPKVGALRLLKEQPKANVLEDDKLIDEIKALDPSRLTDWEHDFTASMEQRFKGRGLSVGQREKLSQIVYERS